MEPLEELQEIAFRRGVGVSRRNALKSEDFQRHCRVSRLLKRLPDREERLQIEYLGARLADRAFQNLPVAFREVAPNWQSLSSKEQERLVLDLRDALTSSRWREIRRREEQSSSSEGIYPAETKSWQWGKIQPNCLGLVQMLVGFARATGAEHALVTPLLPPDFFAERVYSRGLDLLIEHFEQHMDLAPVRRHVRELRRERTRLYQHLSEHDTVRRNMAHHALLLRGRRKWFYIDPYFHTVASVAIEPGGVHREYGRMARDSRQLTMSIWSNFDSFAELLEMGVNDERIMSCAATMVACLRDPFGAEALVPADDPLLMAVVKDARELTTKRQKVSYYAESLCLAHEYLLMRWRSLSSDMPIAYEIAQSETAVAAFVMSHETVQRGVPDENVYAVLRSQYIYKDQLALGAPLREASSMVGSTPEWAILPALRAHFRALSRENEEGNDNGEKAVG